MLLQPSGQHPAHGGTGHGRGTPPDTRPWAPCPEIQGLEGGCRKPPSAVQLQFACLHQSPPAFFWGGGVAVIGCPDSPFPKPSAGTPVIPGACTTAPTPPPVRHLPIIDHIGPMRSAPTALGRKVATLPRRACHGSEKNSSPCISHDATCLKGMALARASNPPPPCPHSQVQTPVFGPQPVSKASYKKSPLPRHQPGRCIWVDVLCCGAVLASRVALQYQLSVE